MTANRDRHTLPDANDLVTPPGTGPMAATPGGFASLAAGVATVIVVFVLGLAARAGAVARGELSIDRHIAADRAGWLTSVAHALTVSATPEVTGIGVAVGLPVVLVLLRRRIAALQALCVMGGALVLALVAKAVIDEHRPPTSLWALPADTGASYPSGHTTVAAAIVAALIVAARTGAGRAAVGTVGGLYVVTVAASRVYVANHYPLDVLGSLLCAAAAALVVAGLTALPVFAGKLARLDPPLARRHTTSSGHR